MPNPEKFEFKTKEENVEKNPEEVQKNFGEYERFGARVKEIFNPQRKVHKEIFSEEVEDIQYITKEGKTFSIRELLPPNWKLINNFGQEFIRGARSIFALALPPKEIIYGSFRISNKGFFLGLLHEIGHSHFFENLDKKELSHYSETFLKLTHKREREILTSQEKELYKKYVINNERKAWAWALKTLRGLRKQGIDLAPELTSIKEILCYVMTSLSSYEKELSLEAQEEILKVIFGGEIEKGEKFLKEKLRSNAQK